MIRRSLPKAVPAPGFYGGVVLPIDALMSSRISPGAVSPWDGHSVVEMFFGSFLPSVEKRGGLPLPLL